MDVTGDLAEYAARPYVMKDVTITAGSPTSTFDERRGEHLLSPGDLVRHGSNFWEVTGVFLGTDPGSSNVTMRRHDGAVEYTVPLQLLDACSIFLLADKRRSP
jgi:hypothetical protein